MENTSPSFLGAPYDLSGLGWWSVAGDSGRVKHTTLIAPLFSVNAAHYPFAVGDTVNFLSDSGTLLANTVEFRATSYLDQSVTRYSRAFTGSEGLAITRVLDISSGNYVGQPVLMVGSHGNDRGTGGPFLGSELATASVNSVSNSGFFVNSHSTSSAYSFEVLESGDSGSPVYIPYKGQVTLLGTITGAGGSGTALTPSVNTAATNAMLGAYGYALRFTIYDVPADTANTANVWTGSGGTASFASAANWSKGLAPANLPVVFDAASNGGHSTVDVAGSQSVRGILFRANSGTASFTFAGSGTLSVGSTGLRNEDSKTQAFNSNVALSGSQNWEATGGNLSVNGNIANGGYLLVVQGQHDTTINGIISGTGGLAKDEGGTLILGGASTYSGQTFLHSGTIRVGADGALSVSSALVFDTAEAGATLDMNGRTAAFGDVKSQRDGAGTIVLGGGSLTVGGLNSSNTYAGKFSGLGAVNKQGTGTWTLTGDNSSYAGSLVSSGGIIQLGSSHALGGGNNIIQVGGRIQTASSLDVYGKLIFSATQNTATAFAAGFGGNALAALGDNTLVTYHDAITLDRQGSGSGDLKYNFRTAGLGAQKLVIAGDVTSSGSVAGAIGLETWTQGSSQNVIDIQGRIQEGPGGPQIKLNVTGSGTTRLSHSTGNTYSGVTTVFATATLLVNNANGSGTGSGGLDLRATSTLGGTGFIAPGSSNGLSAASGAILAPGDGGIGVLSINLASTTGRAVFQPGARFVFDLGAPGHCDQLAFTGMSAGDVSFSGNTIDFTNLGGLAPGSYTLFTFDIAGAYTGTLSLGSGLGGTSASLIYNPNAVVLSVVPEPPALGLLLAALGILSLVGWRHRSRVVTDSQAMSPKRNPGLLSLFAAQ